MKAGGGNAYVSFLPESQCSRDKAQPETKVRNLMDDMSAPIAQTGANAGLNRGTCTLHSHCMSCTEFATALGPIADAVDLCDLNQQLHTISEEK